jgi:hypothetical protein
MTGAPLHGRILHIMKINHHAARPASIELLEARIAPAAVFTYTDVDGDDVTIKTSKGTNADLVAILTRVPTGLGEELQRIDFSAAPLDGAGKSVFHGTNLSITAKRTSAGGDGRVNVGPEERPSRRQFMLSF